jgi:hypothetical protein
LREATSITVGGKDRQDTLRQPGLLRDLAQQIGVQGRFGRRLQYDRAAGQQRGRELGGRHELRHVPRHHGRDHAHRLAPDEDPPEDAVARLLVREVPRDRERRVPHHHRAEGLREDAPGVRGAVLGGDDPGDLLVPYRDPVLDPGDDLDPLVEAHPGPGAFVERLARDGDRPVHVLGRRVRDASDDLFGVRRDHLDDVLAQRVRQLPADEQLSVFHELGHDRRLPEGLPRHRNCIRHFNRHFI